LKRHLLGKEPISKPCEEQGPQPTVFYRWQKEFFENTGHEHRSKVHVMNHKPLLKHLQGFLFAVTILAGVACSESLSTGSSAGMTSHGNAGAAPLDATSSTPLTDGAVAPPNGDAAPNDTQVSSDSNTPPTYTGPGNYASFNGSGSACTQHNPCSMSTALENGGTVVLMDGIYEVTPKLSVPSGVTLRAQNKWGAHVRFTGHSGEGLLVGGTIMDFELSAPSVWSAVELNSPSAVMDGMLIHDVNSAPSRDYGGHDSPDPACVSQGAVDAVGGATIKNNVFYNIGTRPDLSTHCGYYHTVYNNNHNEVVGNLFAVHVGGFCVHNWDVGDKHNLIAGNTIIDCNISPVVNEGSTTNVLKDNILRGSGTRGGRCDTVSGGPEGSLITASNNLCDISKGSGIIQTSNVQSRGGVNLMTVAGSTIVSDFRNATTAAKKIAVAVNYSVDRSNTGNAGYDFATSYQP
jgi:hypothetical protein